MAGHDATSEEPDTVSPAGPPEEAPAPALTTPQQATPGQAAPPVAECTPMNINLTVGMNVLHPVLDAFGVILRFATPDDFLHRGMVLIQYADVERKKKVLKTRWCKPIELIVRQSAATTTTPSPIEVDVEKTRAQRCFESPNVEVEELMAQEAAKAPQLAAHEIGRVLPQKAATKGTGVAWGICGSHTTQQTKVSISERLKSFPGNSLVQAPSPTGDVLFCRCCPKTVQNILGTIRTHVNSERHKERLEQWNKRALVDDGVVCFLHEYFKKNPKEKDSSVPIETQLQRWLVVEAFMHAGVGLNKLDDLRPLFERNGSSLTASTHLKPFIPKIEDYEFKRIIHELTGQSVCLIYDGTSRLGDCTAVLLRWCSESFEIQQRLVALRTLEKHANGDTLGPFLIDVIGQAGVRSSQVVCTARDSCATNGKAERSMQAILSNAVGMMCISHIRYHTARNMRTCQL